MPYYGILFLKIIGRLDQLGSLRRKSTAHFKHPIPTRQSCKSVFRRTKRFLPHDAMIKLYKAFILLHLEYCSPLFVGIGTGQRNRLEDGNCYILRTLIEHNKSMSYDEFLTTASMTSLYCRRLHQALILLFKCLNGTGPTYIGSLFKHRHTPYRLRGEGLNLELPKFNLKFKKNSFTYSLTKLWNSWFLKCVFQVMLMTSEVDYTIAVFKNVSYSAWL